MSETNLNISDYDALKINFGYNINPEYKYVPFVIYPNEINLLGYYNFTINSNCKKENAIIDIKINIYDDKDDNKIIQLINYEIFSETTDKLYVANVILDEENNILIIWLLNNTEYITKNLMENLIMYPNYDLISSTLDKITFVYGENNNIKKNGSVTNIHIPVLKGVNDNFKKLSCSYLKDQFEYEDLVGKINYFNVSNNEITAQIQTLNKQINDYSKSIFNYEIITTDKPINDQIVESFIPLVFKLPDENSTSELKIIGIEDSSNVRINYWGELKIIKFLKSVFVDCSYRQDNQYLAHICMDKNEQYLIIWLKRYISYNIGTLGLNLDTQLSQQSVGKLYPILKLTDLVKLKSKYFNCNNLNEQNTFTLNLSTMPLLIIKQPIDNQPTDKQSTDKQSTDNQS
jgi:hypothetical protein